MAITPDASTYAADVRRVASALSCGAPTFVAHDQYGSRLSIMLALKTHTVFSAGAPVGMEEPGMWMFAAVVEHGAYWFDLSAYQHPSYIATKLDITVRDAQALGEFFCRLAAELAPVGIG